MKASDASYLAGFLDGDGSIHFQLVRQREYRFGFYIRASLSLSQSTSARHGLEHLQRVIGGGDLRDRGTGMSDLVVTSRPLLVETLQAVEPYVIFKREHVRASAVAAATARPPPRRPGVPEDGTRGRHLRSPKLFEDEADLRRRCRATSAKQGRGGPRNDFPDPARSGGWVSCHMAIYETHNTPAPRNGVKV